jgi:lipooligosaccharide transport system ATP-binding protein
MVQPLIEARNLVKRYGELVAVDDVSFNILPGECYGILGPNGAGKTTTIRMLYGFSPMTAGELSVFGLDLRKHLRTIKARIGVCQQENNLDPDLNLLENLSVFGLFFNLTGRQAREKALALLTFMSLEHRKDAKAMELSGGMTRRMVLARALINDPELLILDEPTTGLDPQSRHQVWERLEELKKKGLTVLLTTHYMDEASRLCDRLLIMDHGRILVEGKPTDLIRQYLGQDVIEVAEPNAMLRAYVKARGLQHEDFGHRMIIYEGNGGNLYQEISKRYCAAGCILRMATLEDVFLKLTGRELRE